MWWPHRGTPVGQAAWHWAACNVFLEPLCLTQQEAERRVVRLLKPGTRGKAGVLALSAGNLALTMASNR